MRKAICRRCGAAFSAKADNQRYCSLRCRERAGDERARSRKLQGVGFVPPRPIGEYKCAFCGNEIPHNRALLALSCEQTPKWCSDRCAGASKRWKKYRERGPLRNSYGTIMGCLKVGETWADRYPLEEIRIEYEMGYTKKVMAERFGISPVAVQTLVKRFGWKRRERTCLGCNSPCGHRKWCTAACQKRSRRPVDWLSMTEAERQAAREKRSKDTAANMTPEMREKRRAASRARSQRMRAVYKAVMELGLLNNGVANAD